MCDFTKYNLLFIFVARMDFNIELQLAQYGPVIISGEEKPELKIIKSRHFLHTCLSSCSFFKRAGNHLGDA